MSVTGIALLAALGLGVLWLIFAALDWDGLAGVSLMGAFFAGAFGLVYTGDEPVSARCHPSYADACLKSNASDYDCEGGSGDGPRYVSGPVTVRGEDPFGLDRDGDGTGCD